MKFTEQPYIIGYIDSIIRNARGRFPELASVHKFPTMCATTETGIFQCGPKRPGEVCRRKLKVVKNPVKMEKNQVGL